MRPSFIHILILCAFVPASAQIHADLRMERSDRSSADLVVSVRALGGDTVLTSSLTGGERVVSLANGGSVVLRRFGLTVPSSSVSVLAEVRRERALVLTGRSGGAAENEVQTWPDARVIDIAPRGSFFSATLEVVVAFVRPQDGTATVIEERSVRIAHGPRPASLASVLDASDGWNRTGPVSVTAPGGIEAAQEWYRMEIGETGMYRLDRTALRAAGIPVESLNEVRRLKLYGLDGSPIPEALTAPRPNGMQELPRWIVDQNANGVLEDNDAVIFYGRSVRDWRYNPSSKSFSHTVNPYAERNVVFLTFDPNGFGRDMDSVASAPGPAMAVTDVAGRIAVDQDRFNFVNSGRRWVGERFDISDPTSVFVNTLSGLVPSTPVNYRAVFFSRSGTVDTFRVAENDQAVLGPVLMSTSDILSVDQIFNYAYESPVMSFQYSGPLPQDRSVLKIMFGTRDQGAKAWLDWFEIFYRRSLTAFNDRLFFPSPDTTAVLEYTVRNLSDRNVLVADVTDHANVRRVSGVEFDVADPSLCRFRLSHASGTVRELAVVGRNGFLAPTAMTKVAAPALRSYSGQAPFIILTPKEFMAEAERLKAHREQHDSLRTLIVDVESIYQEFGGGLADPMAIRDFLVFARSTFAGPVRYVLFFGNGHYDYRNIGTTVRNWVIPYETPESNFQISTYTSDDFFAQLDAGNPRISLAIGRLPGRSAAEMRTLVDKIIRYETDPPVDPWRNRITFVADDGQTATNPFEGALHTSQAENLARNSTPPAFEQQKIYIVEYPTVNSASGRRKPSANEAIIDAFNRGSLVMNFTGHGRGDQWTHEAVYTNSGSVPRLTNGDRLTFLIAATCGFAQWDKPTEQSGGEMLLTKGDGGAIGVVTATRAVYSFDSAELNNVLYQRLFLRDSAGRSPRVGDAFFAMKQVRYGVNDQKYHLLGDPTLRLRQPQGLAGIDSVNGSSTASVSVIPSLGRVRVQGGVRDGLGALRSDFTGRGILELFDAKRSVIVAEWGGYTFEVQGSVLYRGEVSVASGLFAATVPVPKDVSFGSRARLSLYAISGDVDAAGITEQLTIQGTDPTASIDTTGPAVEIFVGSTSFRPGDIVSVDPSLIVVLSDENGINTSTAGIGHRLEAELVEEGRVVDLGEFYRGDLDTYQSGRVVSSLTGLAEGRHTVRVRAWDTRNNSSTAETPFEVRRGSVVDLFRPMNVPNPMRDGTVFTFQRTSSEPISVEVRIYTIAGRLIQTLETGGITDAMVRVPWDGRDREGAGLANGVYLYKLLVRTSDRSELREYIGKLAVLR